MKHTKGECTFEQTEKVESGLDIIIKSGNNIIGWIYRSSEMDKDEYLANAELITEAFNVTNETGFTPRQLAEQKAELLQALRFAITHIDIFVPKKHENPELKELINQAIQKATP